VNQLLADVSCVLPNNCFHIKDLASFGTKGRQSDPWGFDVFVGHKKRCTFCEACKTQIQWICLRMNLTSSSTEISKPDMHTQKDILEDVINDAIKDSSLCSIVDSYQFMEIVSALQHADHCQSDIHRHSSFVEMFSPTSWQMTPKKLLLLCGADLHSNKQQWRNIWWEVENVRISCIQFCF